MEAAKGNPKNEGPRLLEDILPAPGAERWGRVPPEGAYHSLDDSLDMRVLLGLCEPALERGGQGQCHDTDPKRQPRRGHHDSAPRSPSCYGAKGLPDDTIKLKFVGSAGQSFGAFLPRGVTFDHRG